MVNKLLEIEECAKCEYCRKKRCHHPTIIKNNKDGLLIHRPLSNFPDWCPLEDAKNVVCECSACGKKYDEDDWPNAWRCNNCY